MANNYYDATGVLALDQVTPVITALFGGFNLDPAYPGNGRAYIARISESNDPQWDDVQEGLADLAATLGLDRPDQDDESPLAGILRVLAAHFGAEDDEALENLIEQHAFEDGADLEALFLVATCFDDGHHLAAIQFEGCWHCSKPRLFEFGGDACFLSREVRLFGASTHAMELGEQLRKAVLTVDAEEASALIALEAVSVLSGINDDAFRSRLRRRVAERLFDPPASGDTA
ncbi:MULTISPECIES: hypothetical protein [Gammaproteobacteria]|uniref:hypothetical protein n=1 Tax=Gammaproteobacteria TaxID=1236 RepID=UPI00112AA40D|nr:hypothetical protein [Pseudomonas sp. Hp2]